MYPGRQGTGHSGLVFYCCLWQNVTGVGSSLKELGSGDSVWGLKEISPLGGKARTKALRLAGESGDDRGLGPFCLLGQAVEGEKGSWVLGEWEPVLRAGAAGKER